MIPDEEDSRTAVLRGRTEFDGIDTSGGRGEKEARTGRERVGGRTCFGVLEAEIVLSSFLVECKGGVIIILKTGGRACNKKLRCPMSNACSKLAQMIREAPVNLRPRSIRPLRDLLPSVRMPTVFRFSLSLQLGVLIV